MMWMKLCDRYATRGNVRGYTYNDEMRGQALLQLAQIGLQFDESRAPNLYTTLQTLQTVLSGTNQKNATNIRDDIPEMNNMNQLYTPTCR